DSLEQDSNVLRIKRLILFTCHDIWSNDINEVKALQMYQLVRELMLKVDDINVLKHKLNSHVKQLSKQSDYLLAADSIIDALGFLYTLRDEGKLSQSFLNAEGILTNTEPIFDNSGFDNQSPNPHQHNLKYLANLFDLRTDISRNISPL
ncbi:MAG: hypothetical protein ACKPFK_20765, partial [Dolichospermum sp.]